MNALSTYPGEAPRSPRALRGTLQQLQDLAGMIGHTPLLRLTLGYRGHTYTICAKAESYNLTGSIKDRMAWRILHEAALSGQLKPGDTIVEATSGNTGIAFAALGRALGHPVRILMPDWMSEERKTLIRLYGAEVELVSAAQGGFLGSIARARQQAVERADVFLPSQFDNWANVLAHEKGTGPEILHQLDALGLRPTAFVAGVGTGGTVMGVGRALRARYPGLPVHPLEPAESPTLSTGCKVGKHRLQGISDEFIPSICRLQELSGVVAVHDGDAIRMAQRLSREWGLGVGLSSGANLLGALQLAVRQGPGSVVVTVFCDDSKKYLSTDFSRDLPASAGHCCDEIDLMDWQPLPHPTSARAQVTH
jgi:cysteine synthase A